MSPGKHWSSEGLLHRQETDSRSSSDRQASQGPRIKHETATDGGRITGRASGEERSLLGLLRKNGRQPVRCLRAEPLQGWLRLDHRDIRTRPSRRRVSGDLFLQLLQC